MRGVVENVSISIFWNLRRSQGWNFNPLPLISVRHTLHFETDEEKKVLGFKQARKPRSYASSKLRLTYRLTGVECRATSVAKNISNIVCQGLGR